ncbi:MAG: hypothetical protein ABR573_02945 [Candidatus Dormibacteria bacterium]
MSVAIALASGFVESLLLVLAVQAVRSGRRLYAVAIAGMALLIYARVADGFIPDTTRLVMSAVGLVVAGLTVAADVLFEVAPQDGSKAEPPV